jgi:hypothetical protein
MCHIASHFLIVYHSHEKHKMKYNLLKYQWHRRTVSLPLLSFTPGKIKLYYVLHVLGYLPKENSLPDKITQKNLHKSSEGRYLPHRELQNKTKQNSVLSLLFY